MSECTERWTSPAGFTGGKGSLRALATSEGGDTVGRLQAMSCYVHEHDGQVWFYDPAAEMIQLRTIFGVNPDPDVDKKNYDGPDNITVSPYGGVILAEDGEGIQHLVGVTRQSTAYPLAATT
ncbi:alkaline phosphatase PhoX [Actinopolymorpha pittospori]